MIIKCPNCEKPYEYDDVFDSDVPLPIGPQETVKWTCDDCECTFRIMILFDMER